MPVPHQQQSAPPGAGHDTDTHRSRPAGWVVGMSLFAATMMLVIGFFHMLQGIAALFDNAIFVVAAQYVFSFDLAAWGWIHLLAGILLTAAGFAVMTGRLWARSVGIGFAVLSVIANFLFLPYYPVWSVLIIAVDVFVIWALCVYTGEGAQD